MEAADQKQGVWALLRPILRRYMRPELWLIIPAVLAGVIAASAGFGFPLIINEAFPIVFGEQELPDWAREQLLRYIAPEQLEDAKLWVAVLLIPLLMILRGIGTYVNSYLLAMAGTRILRRMWVDMFAKLQQLSFSFFDRHRRGHIMTIVIQFTQAVQAQMVTIMNDIVLQPLTLICATAYLIYAAYTNSESAMLLGNLLISALCVPLIRLVGKRMVKKMTLALGSMQVITSTVEETLSAQREVRAFNLEDRRVAVLQNLITEYNSLSLRMAAWQLSLAPAVEIVSSLALAYSLYRGCGDGLTLEQFAAISTAFYFCYDPLKRLGGVINQTQLLGTFIHAMNSILLAEDDTPEPAHPTPLPSPIAGVVDFDHVTFAYHEEKTVLHDITVHVPAGQIVALVGPSGSGKTTFINLLCRFYDAVQGAVRIDGVDVRELSRHERTGAIGLVSQFSALFNDTIRENIRVGRPGATDAEVLSAGASARVTEFAESRPEGYDFTLAEGGGGLSGGQRQRVSIARAFLKNAPILILDEATSALDMKSEAYIQAALEDLARGHTTFIIAHRFSAIRMAQRILVFEAGRIIADGTHTHLYESCLLYRSLYDEQVRQAAQCNAEKELPA